MKINKNNENVAQISLLRKIKIVFVSIICIGKKGFLLQPFFILFTYLYIYGCAGSLLQCRLSLVSASRGYSLVVVLEFLIAVASPGL